MVILSERMEDRVARSAFTLVELVFVMVIIAILLSFTSPQFARTAARLRVEHTAFELTQLLRYARERAISQNDAMAVEWDGQAHRARVVIIEGTNRQQAAPAGGTSDQPILQSARVPAEIAVRLMRGDAPTARVEFFPDGTSDSATTLEVSHGANAYTIHIDEATGEATLTAGPAAR